MDILNSRWRWIAAAAIALLLAGSMVAVLTRGGDRVVGFSSNAAVGGSLRPTSEAYASSDVALGMDSKSAPPAPRAASSPPPAHDRIVHTGSIHLSVPKGGFRSAFDRVAALATELGGFVANSGSEQIDGRLASGHLSLRVPTDRFETARSRLAALGKVEQESIGGEDVGGQLVDLDARLRSLRAQEDALRTLLNRAKTVGEVIQVQEQLGVTRQQIEQLAAEQASLNDRVSFATFEVMVAEPGAAVTPPATGVLRRSWERAVGGSLAVIGGSVVVVGYAVPLAFFGLLGFAIYRLANGRRLAFGAKGSAAR